VNGEWTRYCEECGWDEYYDANRKKTEYVDVAGATKLLEVNECVVRRLIKDDILPSTRRIRAGAKPIIVCPKWAIERLYETGWGALDL